MSALIEQWRQEAEALTSRYVQPALATLTLKHVEELEAALSRMQDEELSLKDAAKECGYTADHLGRLVKAGTLTNHGTKARPKVRRGELPSKVLILHEPEQTCNVALTRKQIARAVINRHEVETTR